MDAAFVADVSKVFQLGPPDDVAVEAMTGSSNRLWRFAVHSEHFVVKEFAHDAPEDLGRRRRAAAFEWSVFRSALVAMPEPVVSGDGEMVVRVQGSRGEPQAVRVHRWLDGEYNPVAPLAVVEAAGASLHVLQAHGQLWSAQATGSIRWWDVEPLEVVDRLRYSELSALAVEANQIARDALEVISASDLIEGKWVYSHCDHKPENALIVHGRLAILDWDECGHCHPRLEAVEAALRWAGANDPRREAFVQFLDGYVGHGATLGQLSERDFGKWLAGLLGWFSFQGRRALGEWPADTPPERRAAATMATEAITGLRSALSALPEWVSWWR